MRVGYNKTKVSMLFRNDNKNNYEIVAVKNAQVKQRKAQKQKCPNVSVCIENKKLPQKSYTCTRNN